MQTKLRKDPHMWDKIFHVFAFSPIYKDGMFMTSFLHKDDAEEYANDITNVDNDFWGEVKSGSLNHGYPGLDKISDTSRIGLEEEW